MSSPSSIGWIPATHLIRVDLPAPLSPTSAITSPDRTSKSTFSSACTEPKLFEIPRSSSVGVAAATSSPSRSEVEALLGSASTNVRQERDVTTSLLAVLLELADADVAPLQEAVLEEQRVVRLRDRDRRQLRERHLAGTVRDLRVDACGLRALDQRDRKLRGRAGLELDRLVDGHRLP